jgi:hypothetical protein
MRSTNFLDTPVGRALLSGALVLATAAAGAPVVAEDCSRVSLSPPPAWLSDAIWLRGSGKVLAVDAGLNRLLLYSSDGKGTILPEPKGEYPTLLAASGDRILLELVGREVITFDADLKERQTATFLKDVATPLGPLSAVNQWTAVDDSLLFFGHVRGANLPRGYQPGLFRISTTGTAHAAELLQRVNSWDYYVLGYQYLTSFDKAGYFLNLDHEARLYEIEPGSPPRLLPAAVPPEFRSVPPINAKMNGPADAPALYDKLERLKMLTGIYGNPDDKKLYLLAREPAPKGVTVWWLYRVDPKQGKVEGKAQLPTKAKHLSVVISPKAFYLIERGDLDTLGRQATNTMVTVPVSLIERAPLEGTEVCSQLRE